MVGNHASKEKGCQYRQSNVYQFLFSYHLSHFITYKTYKEYFDIDFVYFKFQRTKYHGMEWLMLDPVDPPYRMYHVSYGLSCFLQSPLFCHGLSQSFSTIVYFPISNNLIHSFNNNYTYAFNLGSHVLQSISFLQLVKYSYICTSESPILWR